MPRKKPDQLNLFGTTAGVRRHLGAPVLSIPSPEPTSKKRLQVEKAFRQDIERAAYLMDLPCIHIEYYCGNKFVPRCNCGGAAVCSRCGQPVLAHCRRTINNDLAGQPDIIGVAWVIETKKARNKKGDAFNPTPEQRDTIEYYRKKKIPALVLSTMHSTEAINFLSTIAKEKYGRDTIAK